MPIKVVITDDHPLVVDGLQNGFRNYPGIEVVGIYNNGADLMEGLTRVSPHVLLLDIQMPGKTGSELVPIIKKVHPDIRIIILSGMESTVYVRNLMQQGCMGYLFKSTTNRELLIQAIEHVYADELFLDPSIKEELLYSVLKAQKKSENLRPKLTQREKEVLKLIIAECSNQEIADKLFLSLRTIENHRYNLLQKLNVKNTIGLVKIAMQMGLVEMKGL